MPVDQDGYYSLIQWVQRIRNQAADDKQTIIALYSFVNPKHDARITSFAKLVNVLNSLQMAFTFIWKHALTKQWWLEICVKPLPEADIQTYIKEFVSFNKIGFIQGLFLAVESSLRLFLRGLDPLACKGGMAEFKSIYACLFSRLSGSPRDGVPLLELLRLVRNTVHNNGVYFDPAGKNPSVTWRSRTYDFVQSKPVDFVTWDLLLEAADALRELLLAVVKDSNLIAIRGTINDPFSH